MILLRIGDVSGSRDNNFNLIRFVAALAVLYSHSYVVVLGGAASEPVMSRLGMTAGGVAVDVFFATSGFLVTSSLVSRRNILAFALSRVLRIYPLLVVACVFMVLLGAVFTTLPWNSYITHAQTQTFFFRNAVMILGASFTLPGVFESVPFSKTVNASLWTLPVEIGLYAVLAGIWICLTFLGRRAHIKVVVLSAAALLLTLHLARYFGGGSGGTTLRLCFMFFSGASLYLLRHRILVSSWILLGLLGSLVLAATNKDVFFVVYSVTVAYLVLGLAYRPAGFIRRFNEFGDYSYGLYILAFPVQQAIIALRPDTTVTQMVCEASLGTLVLACLSWHLIERRALQLKSGVAWLPATLMARGRRFDSGRQAIEKMPTSIESDS